MKSNFKNTKLNTNRGITLVALIITIIILLILAMVSIRLVMNGGIIDKANKATQAYKESEIQEQIKLAYNEWQTARWDGTAGDAANFMKNRLKSTYNLQEDEISVEEESGIFTVTMTLNNQEKTYIFNSATGQTSKQKAIEEYPTVTAGTVTTENSKYFSDGKTAIIPTGYTVSSEPTEQSIDNGLVVKKGDNEWVWIPVSSSDLAAMYTEDATGWTMCGTDVVTKYKSNSRTDVKSNLTRGNPGTTSWREPDVLNNTSYDNKEANWTAAGFSSYTKMATKLRDNYKNMLASVRKNGGFYIGRYELGGTVVAPQEKVGAVMNTTNWYDLYKACKTFGDESNTCSRMIWGCQWDQVCKFISTYKEGNETKNRDLSNSCSYGNYSNSTGDAATNSGRDNFNYTTGRNEAWKTNNIYDFAGNCREWTQEAYSSNYRTLRGGNCTSEGDGSSVTCRDYNVPTYAVTVVTTRPQLYVK